MLNVEFRMLKEKFRDFEKVVVVVEEGSARETPFDLVRFRHFDNNFDILHLQASSKLQIRTNNYTMNTSHSVLCRSEVKSKRNESDLI